jgi:hypothetical protein
MKNLIRYTPIVIIIAIVITACTTQKVTPPTAPGGHPTTNWVVDPKLETALITARAVNDASAPANPFAPAVDIGLGAIAALAAWVAKRKNDQAAQSALLLKTVVQGVENAANPAVKAAIQAHAGIIGVEGELGTAVQKINNGSL